jgi:hypothetical protein
MVKDGRPKDPEGMRSPTCAIALAIVVVLVLSGCGKHYWNKAGAGADDFARDSHAYAHENALYASGTKDCGIVFDAPGPQPQPSKR